MGFDSLVCRQSPHNLTHVGDAGPSAPSGIAAIYRDLVADDARTSQFTDDVGGPRPGL